MSNTTVSWGSKDPDEVLRYEHDFGPELAIAGGDDDGESILDNTADPDDRPTAEVAEGDVVVDAITPVAATNKVQYQLSGGTDGTACKLILQVKTEAGELHQVAAKIKIKSV